MPTKNMTAYVLADNEAPSKKSLEFAVIDVKRENLLEEAFSLLCKLNENQLMSVLATL